jgi:hypothetical protein
VASAHWHDSSGAPGAWHFRQARALRDAMARQAADVPKPGQCGFAPIERAGSAEWQFRQLSSRWHDTQARMLRRAWKL